MPGEDRRADASQRRRRAWRGARPEMARRRGASLLGCDLVVLEEDRNRSGWEGWLAREMESVATSSHSVSSIASNEIVV